MQEYRSIKRIVTGQIAVDGAGVKLVRVIGVNDTKDFDPFLMFDAFDSKNPEDYIKGFPEHPHRGIETITYLIEGDIEHIDSMGNKGNIRAGDCQWMTAGSGIIHKEMPQPTDRMLGAQLWLNLPAKDKMAKPKYGSIPKNEIPVVEENGKKIRVIAGNYKDINGAFEGAFVKAVYLDVEIDANSNWEFFTESKNTLFTYIMEGEAIFGKENNHVTFEKNLLLFNFGNKLVVRTQDKSVRFLLMSAKPLNEPIAWGGPIVMNTRDELNQAFLELNTGAFVKRASAKAKIPTT